MHLRHILLSQKFQAEDVQRLLKQGEDFVKLAQRWSQCSSASQGGVLGDVDGKKNLDDDFLEAAKILKVHEISGIVRSRFGYHLIRRDS